MDNRIVSVVLESDKEVPCKLKKFDNKGKGILKMNLEVQSKFIELLLDYLTQNTSPC